uniref:Uncharacterized protein n=1 Tax=Chromera velia CCMP2878 TaxID=1169474 RepID=A0A0G4FWT6_9ALVE|eukprot:Cvel_19160.t1-p1 / transcript=Cvel_19160.t1 / gene=Cvel_19160 / organism=Chromera_velia_CCMP2878 / gene_product=hypothetical protein / transcript_product=hypothetical protein / location=Cvel_scaffold1632:538-6600(+) / protein_length=488 / sequence_SO=supercontig / SO=protein_coding / is_pseudo=false
MPPPSYPPCLLNPHSILDKADVQNSLFKNHLFSEQEMSSLTRTISTLGGFKTLALLAEASEEDLEELGLSKAVRNTVGRWRRVFNRENGLEESLEADVERKREGSGTRGGDANKNPSEKIETDHLATNLLSRLAEMLGKVRIEKDHTPLPPSNSSDGMKKTGTAGGEKETLAQPTSTLFSPGSEPFRDNAHYILRIPDFAKKLSSCKEVMGRSTGSECVESAPFDFAEHTFRLAIFPSSAPAGNEIRPGEQTMDVFIKKLSDVQSRIYRHVRIGHEAVGGWAEYSGVNPGAGCGWAWWSRANALESAKLNGGVLEVTVNMRLDRPADPPLKLKAVEVSSYRARAVWARYNWPNETVELLQGWQQGAEPFEFLSDQWSIGLFPKGVTRGPQGKAALMVIKKGNKFKGNVGVTVKIGTIEMSTKQATKQPSAPVTRGREQMLQWSFGWPRFGDYCELCAQASGSSRELQIEVSIEHLDGEVEVEPEGKID